MKLLIDTNVFLEIIFNQRQATEAKKLLANPVHERFISIFSLHSIGILMMRHGLAGRWPLFLRDMISSGRVGVLTLSTADLARVPDVAQLLSLDFDDAYQYVVAESNNLTLASFDKDFDQTPRGRKSPRQINRISIPTQSSPGERQ